MSIKIITFGCRLNIYESEIIKNFLEKNNKIKDKNIIIFNSCSVTEEAEKQLKQAIRKEKRNNKNAIIGVVGCAVQINENIYKNIKEIDFILGNIDKMKEENYQFLENIEKNIKQNIVSNIFKKNNIYHHLLTHFKDKTRGFIQIQTGCDNCCSFCATRLARGKSISLDIKKIIESINLLIENNYNEIVLTGINISSYGKDLNYDINLGKLIKIIFKETDLKRLRLSSLDIYDINDDLKEILFYETKMMPHIHLSLQSGDNEILKKMIRRHSREDVIDFCLELKKYRKNIGIGADFIAGFPTETIENHKNTLDLIKTVNIVYGHIFPYSIRKNTKASLMQQIPINIRKERAKELREICNLQLKNFIEEQKKYSHNVLIENENIGRTENYLKVKLDKSLIKSNNIGNIINIDSNNIKIII